MALKTKRGPLRTPTNHWCRHRGWSGHAAYSRAHATMLTQSQLLLLLYTHTSRPTQFALRGRCVLPGSCFNICCCCCYSFLCLWDGHVLKQLPCVPALPDVAYNCINALHSTKHEQLEVGTSSTTVGRRHSRCWRYCWWCNLSCVLANAIHTSLAKYAPTSTNGM